MSPSTSVDEQDLNAIDAYWRACNYLAVGMIYLQGNPLLREPLKPEHIKRRLLGHWGSSPGLSFVYVHTNRLIREHDVDAIFIAGPGHGAPGVLGPVYLEGSYSETYPDKGEDEEGMRILFHQFSFPGGFGSHCTPELPGSIHEGGELGYSLSHAFGAAFDNPGLLVVAVVGDGEAETGPLATAWHSNKFLSPKRDGAVLPVLHLNGYKINNPTVLARIPETELVSLLRGYGWEPVVVSGSDPMDMHRQMAEAMDHCLSRIRAIQEEARGAAEVVRPTWPMIVLRSPKGWTGPKEVDGHKVEGSWRAHQVPLKDARGNEAHRQALEAWLGSYRPEELFDEHGRLVPALRELSPRGTRRMGANPHANGGLLRRDLRMPDFRGYAVAADKPATLRAMNTRPLGEMLRDIMKRNPDNFRLFGPDETSSNKLDAVYEETGKFWLDGMLPEDADGGHLSPEGRVMEILSEHTLEGWLEGYVLTGRHGLFATYEAFVHVIDSMYNQHAKWLAMCRDLPWRAPVASVNLLITSTVWRQDHNGFTHQDPGFLDIVVNKSPEVARIYLPPDANCLLFTADHCLRSHDNVNVIVCDKQDHLQFLDMEAAIRHCTKGIGIWDWASNDQGCETDLVMAGCGDIATLEALAATALLREHFPALKIRFINVVDLFRMTPREEHPHGLDDADFDSLFTRDKTIIFNFHGYPWLIHRLAYRRTNHGNLHVRGYKERGGINTPMELAIENNIDRFSLAIEAINRVPQLAATGAHVKEKLRDEQIDCRRHAHEYGVDKAGIRDWTWPL